MSRILIDTYSTLCLAEYTSERTPNKELLPDMYHTIENMVLCEEVLVPRNQAERWGLNEIRERFQGIFAFVEAESLVDPKPIHGDR